ncbi:hypothetical protein U1Q18_009914 [Sarracenia purpurea var. burkii]
MSCVGVRGYPGETLTPFLAKEVISVQTKTYFRALAWSSTSVDTGGGTVRLKQLMMIKDQPFDRQCKQFVLSLVMKLEAGEKKAKGVPFDSTRMANLKVRIHRLKDLSPIKIKDLTKELQSSVGVGVRIVKAMASSKEDEGKLEENKGNSSIKDGFDAHEDDEGDEEIEEKIKR